VRTQLITRTTAALAVALILAPVAIRAQWRPQQSPTTASLRGVSAVDARVCWASGANGTFLRTTNGGKTWRRGVVPGAETADFRDVEAIDAQTAYLMGVGEMSRIYKTTDGGRTWTLQYSDTRKGAFFDAIAFWDANHGVLLGDPVDGRFTILTTDDGGRTWREVPGDRVPAPLPGEACFAASGTALTVFGDDHAWFGTGGANVGRIYRTNDRGRTWHVAQTPIAAGESSGVFSVVFRDALNGLAVGGDHKKTGEASENVAMSSDGGATWRSATPSLPSGLKECVAFLERPDGQAVLATGPPGTGISYDGGASWTVLDPGGYHSFSFAKGAGWAGWAVGADGRVGRFTVRIFADPPPRMGRGKGGRR
jgi:photosystem II stability/assembly factor-like uncharacterized protein